MVKKRSDSYKAYRQLSLPHCRRCSSHGMPRISAPAPSGDKSRRRFVEPWRERRLGFDGGRGSKTLGMASALSFGLSRCSDTASPFTTHSSARITSEASKCFSHTRAFFKSKRKPPTSCRRMARFHLSRSSASAGKQNMDGFSSVPL